jgi:hypothetical protein
MSFLINDKIDLNGDSVLIDAFGRFRVSEPTTVFSDRGYYNNELLWSFDTVGSGQLDTSTSLQSSELNLTVGTESGARVRRQTRQSIIYQPGKSQQIMLTFVMQPKNNVLQRLGYYNSTDGIYLENDSNVANLVIRNNRTGSVAEDRVTQSAWNVDTMDGNGPSGITLDFTKSQILYIDLEWLGVGQVRVGFVVNGQLYYVHKFQHANITIGTYMGHAALPLRYEIENTAATSSPTVLKSICQQVSSEGGHNPVGTYRSVDSGLTAISVSSSTVYTPLISIRLKPGIENAVAKLLQTPLMNTANTFGQYKIIFNGTLNAATWQSASDVIDYDISATGITGGSEITTGFFSNKEASSPDLSLNKLALGRDIAGTPDVITLAARTISNSISVHGAISWEEIY